MSDLKSRKVPLETHKRTGRENELRINVSGFYPLYFATDCDGIHFSIIAKYRARSICGRCWCGGHVRHCAPAVFALCGEKMFCIRVVVTYYKQSNTLTHVCRASCIKWAVQNAGKYYKYATAENLTVKSIKVGFYPRWKRSTLLNLCSSTANSTVACKSPILIDTRPRTANRHRGDTQSALVCDHSALRYVGGCEAATCCIFMYSISFTSMVLLQRPL